MARESYIWIPVLTRTQLPVQVHLPPLPISLGGWEELGEGFSWYSKISGEADGFRGKSKTLKTKTLKEFFEIVTKRKGLSGIARKSPLVQIEIRFHTSQNA